LNLLCPACHTPLPADADAAVVVCAICAAEVDVTRAGTISGRPRFVPEIDRTGSDVSGFRIESRLGGGGMGTVYRAAAPDGAPVAIKFLAPALADNPDVVTRFAREIAMLTRLEHPAIVRVLAHGTQDGTPWFAMALVEGSDLRARIGAGPLPPAETAAVFGRLFAALAHAHDRGVVHRDLKPANVLLGAGGAQLADFGIARLEAEMLTGPMVTRLTETEAVLGTLPYMSPEQRRAGAIDRRSDLFSAGVMLYEAATGVLPQGAFAPPSELKPAYSRAFDRVVMQLLQADPDRRPASAAQAATSLAAALAPRRFRPVSLAASAVVAALTLVGGAVGLRAMLRPDVNGMEKAAPSALATAAPAAKNPPAPEKMQAQASERPSPTQATSPTAPTTTDEPDDSSPQTTSTAGSRLGKIKKRVVLKTVAEVKKLRAASTRKTANTAPARKKAAPIDAKEFKGLKRSGKLDKLLNAGTPLPEVRGATKAEVVPPEAELQEQFGEPSGPDAGTDEPPPKPGRRKK